MPRTPEDALRELQDAMIEAKTTVRELHEARAAALDVVKTQRKHVQETIKAEVEIQLGAISDDCRFKLLSRANEVIDRIEADWREKLGLPT